MTRLSLASLIGWVLSLHLVLAQQTSPPEVSLTCFDCKSGPCLTDAQDKPEISAVWKQETCSSGISHCTSTYASTAPKPRNQATNRGCAKAPVKIDNLACTNDPKTNTLTCYCTEPNCNWESFENYHVPQDAQHVGTGPTPSGPTPPVVDRSDHGSVNDQDGNKSSAGIKDQWLVLLTGVLSLLLCLLQNSRA